MADRADFAPELGALKSLRPFVFWAQTTLPTAFDDSLSYYEVLTKLCKMVNTMLGNEDTNAENIAALAEAYQELEDFTNNYFENLDVTQEINDKLDALVADGTIGGYVVERATTLFNDYLYGEDGESGKNKEINDMISEAQNDIEEALANFATRSNQAVTTFELNSAASIQTFQGRVDEQIAGISTIVEDWMDDNFTNPSSVVIDDTLTVKDAAAEAYATGKLMDATENMVLATAYWQDYVIDSISGSFILANVSDGSSPAVGTGAPAKTLYIANVTPGETYIVSGVASSYSTTRYTPAYALGNLTYDVSDNPYYEFYDVYPRGWDETQDPGTVYQYVRNQTVRIPTGTTPTVTHLFIVGDNRVPITVRCSRLNVRTDDTLTSESLPAQGKATGDALDTKLPWPVSEGAKNVGSAGERLVSNGDGTTNWVEDTVDYSEVFTGSFDTTAINSVAFDGHGITPANAWSWGERQRSFICRIPDNAVSISVKPQYDGTVVAFLASAPQHETPMLGSHPDFSTPYPTRIRLDIGGDTDYEIQETMNYLFVLVKNSSGNFVGPEITFTTTSTTLQAVDEELADETNAVDRRNEICAMLYAFGKCELSKGVFYSYKNLYIPDGAVLCGSGKNTTIKMLASVASGSCIRMGAYSTIENLLIKGSDSNQSAIEAEGTRNGIEWTGENQFYGTIDNCRIVNFSGAGMYLHDTTQQTYRGMSIVNCNIRNNYVGIDIRNDSEFNKISNCVITGNNIGYRNRGGNNSIVNCGVDANVTGILVDDNAGTNNGHGIISNCSINHSDSNAGYGIIVEGTGRMLISNCNLYFSKIRLENTDGNVVSNCGFGRNADWEIAGGNCSLFIGCMVRGWDSGNSPVTISENTTAKIVNCFDRTGVAYTQQ